MSEHSSTGPSRALPRRTLRHDPNTQDATIPMMHAPGCIYGLPRAPLAPPARRGLAARYAALVADTRADLVSIGRAFTALSTRIRTALQDRVTLCAVAGTVGLLTGGLVVPRWPVESARAELAAPAPVVSTERPRASEPAALAMCEAPTDDVVPQVRDDVVPQVRDDVVPRAALGCRDLPSRATPSAPREPARAAVVPRATPKLPARVAPPRARPTTRPAARPASQKPAAQVARPSSAGEAARRAALAEEAQRVERAERAAAFFARSARSRSVATR